MNTATLRGESVPSVVLTRSNTTTYYCSVTAEGVMRFKISAQFPYVIGIIKAVKKEPTP